MKPYKSKTSNKTDKVSSSRAFVNSGEDVNHNLNASWPAVNVDTIEQLGFSLDVNVQN